MDIYLQSALRKIDRHEMKFQANRAQEYIWCTEQAGLLIGDPMSGPRVALAN